MTAHDSAAATLAWSPDGQRIAVGSLDETVSVWDIATRQVLYTLGGQGQVVASIAWSPDGLYLYTGTIDVDDADDKPLLRQWDANSGRLIREVLGVAGGLEFSRDGRFLAYTGGQVEVRDPVTLALINTYGLKDDFADGFHSTVKTFSRDGSTLAVGYSNGWTRLWDTVSGVLMAQVPAHDEHDRCCPVNGLPAMEVEALYLDERYLTSVTQDGTFRLWDIVQTELLVDKLTINSSRRTEFSEYGARLIVTGDYRIDSPTLAAEIIRVPDPSLERLNNIARACISAEGQRGLALASDTTQLSAFVEQLETLTDAQIPVGCRADLLAIVEAIRRE